MRKMLYTVPVVASVLAANVLLAPQPAYALPDCETETSIRCNGYSVAGRPRLDIYYSSYEECMRSEVPARCGHDPDPGWFPAPEEDG